MMKNRDGNFMEQPVLYFSYQILGYSNKRIGHGGGKDFSMTLTCCLCRQITGKDRSCVSGSFRIFVMSVRTSVELSNHNIPIYYSRGKYQQRKVCRGQSAADERERESAEGDYHFYGE